MKDSKSNILWPLPKDYAELTEDGQKKARIAVLSDHSTPEKFVGAWYLFRKLYLKPMGKSFYKGGFVSSPKFHYEAVYDLGRYARNVLAAPRGTAKSTVVGKEVPILLALTRPYYPIALGLSKDEAVEIRFDEIMTQFTDNPLILNDFGNMKPKRGSNIWNHHYLHLANGATLQGFSVLGRKRGARPRLFILDDPEFDPDSDSVSAQRVLLEKFERILFRQIIPMLESGSGIFWVGTILSRRSFLYHACCTDDPRFAYWNRKVLSAISYDPTNADKVSLLWKEQWSQPVLEARRGEIGNSAFAAEYMNEPISDSEKLLSVNPDLNEYTIITTDLKKQLASVPVNPFEKSSYEVVWKARNVYNSDDASGGEELTEYKKPFSEWASSLFRIGTFDYASGLGPYNDYSCLGIFGFDTSNCLWILDMWMGRAKESVLLRKIYEYNMRWRTRVIGIESSSMQISFADAADEYVTKQSEISGGIWRPRVMPVKYPSNVSKSDRISGLEWRYEAGKIKYPSYMKMRWPFTALYDQTEDFTYDLALLRFDDAIDVVAMTQYTVHNKGVKSAKRVDQKRTLVEQIKSNRPLVPGIPILSGVNSSDLNREEIAALLDRAYASRSKRISGRLIERRRANVTGY